MTTERLAPPDWHPDPSGRHDHRYWDGTAWTEHVADDGRATVDWRDVPRRPTGAREPAPPPPPGAPAPSEAGAPAESDPVAGVDDEDEAVSTPERARPSGVLLALAALVALALVGTAGVLAVRRLIATDSVSGTGTYTGRVESGLDPDVYTVEVSDGKNLVVTLRPSDDLDASLAVAVDEDLLIASAERLAAETGSTPEQVLAELQQGFDPVVGGYVLVFADAGGAGEPERVDTAEGAQGAGLEGGTYLVAVQAFGGTAGEYELTIEVS